MSELQDAIKRVAQTVNNPACHWSDWDGKNAFVDLGVADMKTILAALAAAPDGDMITPPEPLIAKVREAIAPFCIDPKGIIDREDKPERSASSLYNDFNFHPFPTWGDFQRIRALLNNLDARPVSTPPEPVGVTREQVSEIIDMLEDLAGADEITEATYLNLNGVMRGWRESLQEAADQLHPLAKTEGT